LPGETPQEVPGTPTAANGKPGAPVSTTAPLSTRDTLILDRLEKLRKEIESLESDLKKGQQK
jgi:hypothetical protein